MPVVAWVAIGVAVAQMLFTIVWALVRRPAQRIDRLEAAVFGESGVNMKLARYVTTEAFERRMASLDEHVRGVGEEGQNREDRILLAISNSSVALRESVADLKADVRAQAQRVDELMRSRNGDR